MPVARKRRGRKTIWWGAGVALLLIAGWHYGTLALSARAARSDLLAVQEQLDDGLRVDAAGLAVAQRDVDSARSNLDRTRTHLKWDPLVRVAGVLPRVGNQVDATRDLLDIAALLVDAGDAGLIVGQKAVALRDSPPTGEPLTKSLITLLNDTDPELEQIDTKVSEAVRLRQAMGNGALLPPINSVRKRVDKQLPQLANDVEALRQAKGLLPGFLGFNGERRYLILPLNSGELLPGGGLVTAAGVLTVKDGLNGAVDFTDSNTWKPEAEKLGIPYIEPPGPLKRYLLRDFTWNLLVSNWDPDFPTWSQQALEFYELVHGPQTVDGVVAADLTVLERLLSVTGPKTILIDGVGPVTFSTEDAVLKLEGFTRQAFDPTQDRKSVIGDLAQAILSDLLNLPSSRWADAVDIIRKLGGERHIQVLSFAAEEQTLLRDSGWDGRLKTPTHDYLMVNEASVLSTKLNLIIKPSGTLKVEINELGDVNHELRLNYNNPLPEWSKGKDKALVEQLMLGGLYGGYIRVFGPRGLVDPTVEIDDKPALVEDLGKEETADWFGAILPIAPGASKVLTMRWRSTPPGAIADDGYHLLIQKQPGTDGLCLALEVSLAGKKAKEISVSGGSRDARGRVCITTDVEILARF